ncbi:MAG TPA: DUF3857 domain-containing protein [Candidatus Polarisedimenticolia bacterium]|nr:DUF3857 domain-containing protein [Candidatus Polarisedimenticolia bacterium]
MPAFVGKSPAVVLLEERSVEISRNETRERVREAVKILTAEGRRYVVLAAAQGINEDFKLIGGWRVRPDGEVTKYDARAIEQVDADGSYEFSMTRLNRFMPAEARVGDTIAWEFTLKSKPEAYTWSWSFGRFLPTLVSRFALKTPPGWKLRTLVRNHPEIPAVVDEEGFTSWVIRDIEGGKDEPLSPARRDLVPTLMVASGPGPGAAEARQFETWESVARWYAGIVAPQIVADDSVRRMASDLSTAAAGKLDAIKAIARFVQGVRYLDVAPGRSTAEPHPAPQILKNRFGDCEDKSVLTIALLKEVGIEAFPVLALTRSGGSVSPEFPSPFQFNHAIVAISMPPGTQLPSMLDAGAAGRVLIFDPTSTTTGLGDLPRYLQGTHAVLSHASRGALISLPVLAPETSSRVIQYDVSFPGRGGIDVTAKATYTGQYAASERSYYSSVRGDKRTEEFRSWIAANHGKPDIRVLDVTGVERPDDSIVLTLDLWMPLPGKDLGDLRTMASRFLLSSRAERLEQSERTTPLRIEAGYQETDRTVIHLPDGWRVAGSPPATRVTGPVGEFLLETSTESGTLILQRSLTMKAATVAPGDYAPVKKFFDDIFKADGAALAFEKIPSTGG